MLNIKVERAGSTATVHCVGRIVVGEDLSAMRDAVLRGLDKRVIILDLSRVDRIDAGGLGMLVLLNTCANGLGTEFKLLSPSPQVAEMLRLTKLNSVFTVCAPDEAGDEPAPSPAYVRCEACA